MTTTTKKTGTKEWAEKNINFSKGCSNNCKYCYAKFMANRFGWKDIWDKMEHKEELATKQFRKFTGTIMFPSSHDIVESNVDLAIKILNNLLIAGNKVLVVSKPNLQVMQKIEQFLFEIQVGFQIGIYDQIEFRFTIGHYDNDILSIVEPNAPCFQERLDSLELLYKSGYKTSVSIEPYLTRDIATLIEKISPFVTGDIWVGKMNNFSMIVNKYPELEFLREIYTKKTVLNIYQVLQQLNDPRIKYKDTFRTVIGLEEY